MRSHRRDTSWAAYDLRRRLVIRPRPLADDHRTYNSLSLRPAMSRSSMDSTIVGTLVLSSASSLTPFSCCSCLCPFASDACFLEIEKKTSIHVFQQQMMYPMFCQLILIDERISSHAALIFKRMRISHWGCLVKSLHQWIVLRKVLRVSWHPLTLASLPESLMRFFSGLMNRADCAHHVDTSKRRRAWA